jgi:hypothetical protein
MEAVKPAGPEPTIITSYTVNHFLSDYIDYINQDIFSAIEP